MLTGRDGSPKFSVEIVTERATPGLKYKVQLGEMIIEGWELSEYSPRERTIILRRDTESLVVRSGKRVPLPELPPATE